MPRKMPAQQARNKRRKAAAGGTKKEKVKRRGRLTRDNVSGQAVGTNRGRMDAPRSRRQTKFRKQLHEGTAPGFVAAPKRSESRGIGNRDVYQEAEENLRKNGTLDSLLSWEKKEAINSEARRLQREGRRVAGELDVEHTIKKMRRAGSKPHHGRRR